MSHQLSLRFLQLRLPLLNQHSPHHLHPIQIHPNILRRMECLTITTIPIPLQLHITLNHMGHHQEDSHIISNQVLSIPDHLVPTVRLHNHNSSSSSSNNNNNNRLLS